MKYEVQSLDFSSYSTSAGRFIDLGAGNGVRLDAGNGGTGLTPKADTWTGGYVQASCRIGTKMYGIYGTTLFERDLLFGTSPTTIATLPATGYCIATDGTYLYVGCNTTNVYKYTTAGSLDRTYSVVINAYYIAAWTDGYFVIGNGANTALYDGAGSGTLKWNVTGGGAGMAINATYVWSTDSWHTLFRLLRTNGSTDQSLALSPTLFNFKEALGGIERDWNDNIFVFTDINQAYEQGGAIICDGDATPMTVIGRAGHSNTGTEDASTITCRSISGLYPKAYLDLTDKWLYNTLDVSYYPTSDRRHAFNIMDAASQYVEKMFTWSGGNPERALFDTRTWGRDNLTFAWVTYYNGSSWVTLPSGGSITGVTGNSITMRFHAGLLSLSGANNPQIMAAAPPECPPGVLLTAASDRPPFGTGSLSAETAAPALKVDLGDVKLS